MDADISFTITIGDRSHQVRITRPFKVGNVRYIFIDEFLQGQLVKGPKGWEAHLNKGSILTADDIAQIIEMLPEIH